MPGFFFRLCHIRIKQDVTGQAQSANYRKQHLIRRIDKSLFDILNMPKANPGLIGKLLLRKTAILSFRFDASPQLLQIAGWGIPSFWHSHLLSNQAEIFAVKPPIFFHFIAFSTLYCFMLIAITLFDEQITHVYLLCCITCSVKTAPSYFHRFQTNRRSASVAYRSWVFLLPKAKISIFMNRNSTHICPQKKRDGRYGRLLFFYP